MIHIATEEEKNKIRHEYWGDLRDKYPYYVCYEYKAGSEAKSKGMTREEIIAELKTLEYYNAPFDNTPEMCNKVIRKHNALIYAIKILEQELKIGHWIEHPHEAGENWEYPRYECSECHVWADDDSDFCPNCGAKMESEDKDDKRKIKN